MSNFLQSGGTGAEGPAGVTGPQGATGLRGATGVQGVTGITGATGPQGATGPNGINAYSTSFGFSQPQIGTTVPVQVPSGYWMQVGQHVFIGSGGSYQVASGSAPTFYLLNLGYSGVNIPVGSLVATGSVSPDGIAGVTGVTGATGPTGPQGSQGSPGVTGATGPNGINAYSTSIGFSQPAVGTTVPVQVQSGYWMQVGQHVFIGSGGSYQVASGSAPTFYLLNLGYSGVNIPVGSLVATGSVSPDGVAGPTGVTGPTGPAGATGTFFSSSATSTWAGPTGIVSNGFLLSTITTSAVPTSVMYYYPVLANSVSDVSVTILATNGMVSSGAYQQGLRGVYGMTGVSGPVVAIQGAYTTSQAFPLAASGWNGNIIATGQAIGLVVSTPTLTYTGTIIYTGTVKWAGLLQITTLPSP
jgi:collagen type VII alpha